MIIGTLIRKVPYALLLNETDLVLNEISRASRLELRDWILLVTAACRLSFSSNSLLSAFVENKPGLGTESVGDLASKIITMKQMSAWTASLPHNLSC